ncbi:MAG: OpgC domain-containing protein [Gammaproteobacteria bacterium]|nr:OpgC domain-containing protein [Gammaproteobacteria bacterium]
MSAGRDTRLDALRGFFLVVMAGVHVPTPLSRWLHEPFGYLSAAEGFVFLGACLAGYVFAKVRERHGAAMMRARIFARVRRIYAVHLGLVLAAVFAAWLLAPLLRPLANHFSVFLAHPLASLVLIPLLLHQPPLFDILPLYIVFLALTPAWLGLAARHGWARVLAVSAAFWAFAQVLPLAPLLAELRHSLPVDLGSFNLLGWQLLWVLGLALGETTTRDPPWLRRHRGWLLAPALVVVAAGLLCRHRFGLQPAMLPNFAFWTDKWRLGPLRLANSIAWAIFLWSWSPRPGRRWLAPTALLGRNSLAVFAAHIPLAIAATTLLHLYAPGPAAALALGLGVIAGMYVFAWLLERRDDAGRSAR